jgi:hypothetical protein
MLHRNFPAIVPDERRIEGISGSKIPERQFLFRMTLFGLCTNVFISRSKPTYPRCKRRGEVTLRRNQ